MKSRLALVVDIFVFTLGVFVFGVLICGYFTKDLAVIFAWAATFAVAVAGLIGLRAARHAAKNKQEYLARQVLEFFLLKEPSFTLNYFYKAFFKKYNPIINGNYIVINKTMIVPHLYENLLLKNVVLYYSNALKQGYSRVVILSCGCDKGVLEMLDRLPEVKIDIFNSGLVYRLLKSLNSLPIITEKKRNKKLFFLSALSPQRAKGYLFSAFTLLFGAFFSFYSLYFVVAGGLCLALAILCKADIPALSKNKISGNANRKNDL